MSGNVLMHDCFKLWLTVRDLITFSYEIEQREDNRITGRVYVVVKPNANGDTNSAGFALSAILSKESCDATIPENDKDCFDRYCLFRYAQVMSYGLGS